MVLGSVQSGKTTNFNAVINSAIDLGYQLIIVFCGTIEDLRRQTYQRIENDVEGVEQKMRVDLCLEKPQFCTKFFIDHLLPAGFELKPVFQKFEHGNKRGNKDGRHGYCNRKTGRVSEINLMGVTIDEVTLENQKNPGGNDYRNQKLQSESPPLFVFQETGQVVQVVGIGYRHQICHLQYCIEYYIKPGIVNPPVVADLIAKHQKVNTPKA
jgi:hypothetical protein